jgi:hypothetical protein
MIVRLYKLKSRIIVDQHATISLGHLLMIISFGRILIMILLIPMLFGLVLTSNKE